MKRLGWLAGLADWESFAGQTVMAGWKVLLARNLALYLEDVYTGFVGWQVWQAGKLAGCEGLAGHSVNSFKTQFLPILLEVHWQIWQAERTQLETWLASSFDRLAGSESFAIVLHARFLGEFGGWHLLYQYLRISFFSGRSE